MNDKNLIAFYMNNSFSEQYIPQPSETVDGTLHSGSPIQNLIKMEEKPLDNPIVVVGLCCICENYIIGMHQEIKLKCLHTFCRECIMKSIDENEELRICCPFPTKKCNMDISDAEIENIFDREKFQDVMTKLMTRISKAIEDKRDEENTANLILNNLAILEMQDYNENTNIFECPVCSMEVEIGSGVILKNCLHKCCKECINLTIQHSVDIEVKCPFMDNNGSCNKKIQDREIRALASKEVFEKHLEKSLNLAETVCENTFHCKNPNCKGWVVYDKDVRSFQCPVCTKVNCIACKVIHHGKTCQQYEEEINPNARNVRELLESEIALNALVASGEAMHCPNCDVIVQKADGCDYLTCTLCKLAICWITRKPRHDLMKGSRLIEGCKCKANGILCHPKCGNCH
ncbi:unnamed protein product [Diamesa serratosioi]